MKKSFKIIAWTLLLLTPFAHAMNNDCSIHNQLLFVGASTYVIYKGVPLIKNAAKNLYREIEKIEDDYNWKKDLICREEGDTENINIPIPTHTNQITVDELITITHQGLSEQDLETSKKSAIKEAKKRALLAGCTMSALCLTSLLALYTVYQCNTQN
jgi:hypothetical protein